MKSWDHKLYHAEFAYNHSVNRNLGFSPFLINYDYDPCSPLDLAPIPDLKRVPKKAEDLIVSLQELHTTTKQNLLQATSKYKRVADKKRRLVEFEVGDIVWAILTKD